MGGESPRGRLTRPALAAIDAAELAFETFGAVTDGGRLRPMTNRKRREQTFREELANAFSHGIGLVAMLAGAPILVIAASERDAWAEYGHGAFPAWVELRDEQGFLRVRIESAEAGGVGEYAYACEGPAWPRGSSAPETHE